MSASRDERRSAVYAAEDQVAALLLRGGSVDFHGSTLDVPLQRRFADIASIQTYLTRVRDCSWGHGSTPSPLVRARRGETRAHWSAPDTIAIPQSQGWAMTELVVLHEYAHHVNWHYNGATGHDAQFCEITRELVGHAIAPAAGLLLLAAYHHAGAWG